MGKARCMDRDLNYSNILLAGILIKEKDTKYGVLGMQEQRIA